MIRVLLADDHEIVRDGLKRILAATADVQVTGEAASGDEALALAKAGEQATHLLQNALQAPADLEMKRRLEALLERLDHPLADVNQLRFYRCLTLLERIGTSEARQLLNELTQGAPAAWLTVEARYSLKRVPPN